ncbi:winged helix-turn-helix domain-containing protein [Parasphingorhabdus cellanae]|uniref:YcaQ family DNA glycosylase n=1 Tax=Parasphingorhabdus cellanae TaxID=2806553 RepID=A0ABX7SZ25_9SPHN|nr:crosslink repair DNA glycosylase YcaQ family protein [Parasphingorhabdus cellanae]QTD54526.1 YcaQ family DNA glycosylase [Parasphingorhabdus cellanae]
MVLRIKNRDARRLWLDRTGLADTPTGSHDLLQIIKDLGFVQLDTIRNVTRAHHHILWSRNQNYREPMLNKLLANDRSVFEHFTHDASVLPMDFYPLWQRQFRRLGARAAKHKAMDAADIAAIKARISREGPLSTHAFDTKIVGKKEMWARPPHKRALDQLWYAGELATSHREKFVKYYDLAERVIPAGHREVDHSDDHQVDWLCRAALDRLGFGTLGDIQRFWAAMDAPEVKTWAGKASDHLVPIELETVDGDWVSMVAPANIGSLLVNMRSPTSRLRILSPFDPAIRDRTRLSRLFGFDYRIEIFVPAAKRRWGYYVYPLLERDRFVGRIELKADRKAGIVKVVQIWPESGVKWTADRAEKLDAELSRLARFIGADTVEWQCGRIGR